MSQQPQGLQTWWGIRTIFYRLQNVNIDKPLFFFLDYWKNVVKNTQFQMLPKTTIFNFITLNFVN